MQKIKTSLVTAGCLFFIQFAHGATVEIDGETLNCDVKSFSHLLCEGKGANKGTNTLVLMEDNQAIAFEQDSTGMVKIRSVRRVSENRKILFHSDETFRKSVDTKARRISTTSFIAGVNDPENPELQEFTKKAKAYLRSSAGIINNTVKVNYNNKNFECDVGYRNEVVQTGNKRRFDKDLKCPFYACKGKDGEDAILHVPVHDDENGNSNLVIMKNGTAQYIDSGFTVDDGSDILVETGLISRPLALESRLPVSSDFIIPNGYKGDKKTFLYMTNVNHDDYLVHAQKLCSDKIPLKNLFQEQKKIGDKLSEISEQQELIELVTMVDDQLRYIYVDKSKGLKAGCLYNEKIYAGSTDNKVGTAVEGHSGPEPVTTYLDEEDIQNLYKKVSFIPAGNAGLKAGAEARAHMISRKLKDLGIEHQKIWIKGNLNKGWNYNVAVTVVVKNKEGEYERFVIDPALNNKAVSEEAWIRNTVKDNKDPILKTTYPFAENVSNFHRTVVAHSSPDMYGMDIEVLSEKEKTDRAYKELGEENQKQAAGQYE
jgi:hypothetical protein